jgi:hypothetical protein
VILSTLLVALVDPSGVIIGHTAILFCIAMFASPLAAVPAVLETKSARAIPLSYTVAALVNCVLWSFVGLFDLHDDCVYIPTLLGLALSLLQIYLKVLYGNGPDLMTPLGSMGAFDSSAVSAI